MNPGINPPDFRLLLCRALRDPGFHASLLSVLEVNQVESIGADQATRDVYEISTEVMAEHGRALDTASLSQLVPGLMTTWHGNTSETDSRIAGCIAEIEHLAQQPMPDLDVCQVLVQKHWSEVEVPRRIEQAYFEFKMRGELRDFMATLHEIQNEHGEVGASPTCGSLFPFLDSMNIPYDDDPNVQQREARLKTGTPLDLLHGSQPGVYRGVASLLLGPTSGGKTVMAYEVITKAAAAGHNVGFFATEEDLEHSQESLSRVLAGVTGIPVSKWVDAKADARLLAGDLVSDKVLTQIRKFDEQTTVFRIGSDFDADVMEEVIGSCRCRFDVIVLDWAGPVADMAEMSGAASSTHQALERLMQTAQQVAKRLNCFFLVCHQLAAEKCARTGIWGQYSEYDSQNCKKLAQHAAACYILTPRDEGGSEKARLIGAKLRHDVKGTELVVKLDYEQTQLRPCIGWRADSGSFVAPSGSKDIEGQATLPSAVWVSDP